MKICHLTTVHSPSDIRIFVKECSSLAAAGYETHLIASGARDGINHGVWVHGVAKRQGGRLVRMTKTVWAVYKKAVKVEADIYHFHDPELVFAGLLLKYKGKKVIYDAHEDVPRQIYAKHWISKPMRSIISRVFEVVENFAAKRLDLVITATPFIRDRFLKLGCRAIAVNNYPLQDEFLPAVVDWSRKERVVCYAGGIAAARASFEMVDAIESSGAKLLLAGKVMPTTELDVLKSRSGWTNVEFHGLVGRNEVRELLARSMAGLVLFHPYPNHINAQPNKLFEYMSAGIPVIASNFPLWREIIDSNRCGLCVDPQNPEDIRKAIKWIINHPDEARQMGINGLRAVREKYSWEKEKLVLLEAYRELAQDKVCHLTSVHTPQDVRIYHKECLTLSKNGYRVTIIVPNDKDLQINDIKIRALPKPKNRLCRMTKTMWQMYRAAIKEKARIYHFHDPELIPLAILLKIRGKTVIYDVHENVPEDILSKDYLPIYLRRLVALIVEVIEKAGAMFFDRIVAVTDTIAKRFPAGKTILLQNYPILGELDSVEGRDYDGREPLLVYIGGITPIRGVRETIAALPLIDRTIGARLLLAGTFNSSEHENELRKMAGWNKVEYLGWQTREKIRETLARARVGIVLFQPVPNNTDSQPNKLFEYMAAGIPIVASDFPLWREIVDSVRCGLLVNPENPLAIAKAVEWLLQNPNEAKEMGLRGKVAVESKFNWEAESRKLIDMYKNLLST